MADTFEEEFNDRVELYLQLNNIEPETGFNGKHMITKEQDIPAYISRWLYDIPEPTIEELRALDMNAMNNNKKKLELKRDIKDARLPIGTTNQINSINNVKDGSIVFNKSTNKVLVYYSNQWNPIL